MTSTTLYITATQTTTPSSSTTLVNTGPVVEYTLSGLRILTEFTIRVVVHNGVSEQDPGGVARRMCEVEGVTGDICK